MRRFLIIIAGVFLLNGCTLLEVTKSYEDDILYDQQNKNRLKPEAIAGASGWESASTNYSKYFEADTDLYGAVWVCPPDKAIEKFTSIAQTLAFAPDIKILRFGDPSGGGALNDLIQGRTEYCFAKDCSSNPPNGDNRDGKLLSLYMVGDDAFIELAIGPRHFKEDLTFFKKRAGILNPLVKKEQGFDPQKAMGRAWEIKLLQEEKARAKAWEIRKKDEEDAREKAWEIKRKDEEAARIKDQKIKDDERKAKEAQWEQLRLEEKEKEQAVIKRQTEVALAAEEARKNAQADRIVRIDSWAKGFNSSYCFKGRTAFAFLSSVIVDGKSIDSQIGEFFELDVGRVSWEVLQCDKKVLLIHAVGDFNFGTKSMRIAESSILMVDHETSDQMVDGQAIKGFIVLLGSKNYTTVSGASKTVPWVRLLKE